MAGSFAGGSRAGVPAGKDYLIEERQGSWPVSAGPFTVAPGLVLNTGYLPVAVPHFPRVAGLLFFLVAIVSFPIPGFIGGAFGGFLRK